MNRKLEKALEYYNSGKECRKLGKFDEAIKNLKKAKEINYKLGEKSIEASTSEELGFTYFDLAQYEKALKFANEALTIFRKIGNSVGEGNGYVALGNTYSRLGRFSEAIDYQKKACEIFLRTGEQNLAGLTFSNLGKCYNLNGEHEKAIKSCKNAIKRGNQTGNIEGHDKSFLNMGNAYRQLSKWNEAIENCQKSLAICTKRKKDMESELCEAICYGVMGPAYAGLGQREKAIFYCKRSVEMNEKLQNYTDLAIACGNLGQYYLGTAQHQFGNFGECNYQAGLNPSSTYKCISKRLENSIKYLMRAIQIINEQFFNLAVDKNKTSFCDRFYHWHVTLTFPFLLTGRDEAALLILDLGKAKALKILIEQQRRTLPTKVPGRYRDESWISIEDGTEKERLRELCKEIQLKKFDSTVVIYAFDKADRLIIWTLNLDGSVGNQLWTPRDTFSTALATLFGHISPLLARVSVQIPREYSFINQVSLTTDPQVQQEQLERATVDDKAASITRDDTEKQLSKKLVLNARSTSEILQPRACSDNNVDTQSRAPQQSENVNDSTQILSYLYQALIGPVKDVIKGTKLIIVPHGCLFFVPFSSLIDENGCYLSEKYQVQITPSVHTLASSMKFVERNEIGITLLVGNPEIGEVSFKGKKLPPLPAAKKEVENLASLFGAKPLVEADATKERVIQLMRNATIVHIAAHGDKKNGDILLAPNSVNPKRDVPPDEETYLLTQSDILDIKLAARLVVLSCCCSGRGETCSEGVLGIARSFMGAGARSVLVALWNIDDKATQEFMELFYAKLCQGTFVCQALKETINIFQQHELYNSFSYWAPFTILGEDVKFTKKEIDEIRIRNSQTFN